jgi:dihydrolipoamide dehydrogenase
MPQALAAASQQGILMDEEVKPAARGLSKWLLVFALLGAVAAYWFFDLGQYLSLTSLKSKQGQLQSLYAANPLGVMATYMAIYVAITALSFPGAALMTLAGGGIFGLSIGTVLVSFASTIGATLAFLATRYLLRDSVQSKVGARMEAVNKGIEKDGAFYLFTLRLVPAVPFFIVNLAMGLTRMKAWTFYWVSQLGMLAGTLVFVNAGTQLAQIESLRGILSPALIASFVALGVFPLLAKKFLHYLQSKKVYAGYSKPARFDQNIVVIGGGSAGLITGLIAAAVKAKVALVEKHNMGGDCLNTGCVPSKALIKTARLLHQAKHAKTYGIESLTPQFHFAQAMERVQDVIAQIAPHDSVERFTSLGVECLQGNARIVSPWEVEVTSSAGVRKLTAKSIVIAAGARPLVPPITGIEHSGYLTSDTLWNLRELPKRLLVLGGGPIGCELAQAFARFGSAVTQVEMAPRLMMREDTDVSTIVEERFRSEGIQVLTNHKALAFEVNDTEKVLVCEHAGATKRLAYDVVLLALGRSANVSGYGLEDLKVGLTKGKTVEVNEFLQTNYPNIYAAGDVAGPYQFTHTASHMAWYAAVNSLFGVFKRFAVDYSVIPWATFTDPEVARVGLNEQEARTKGIAYEVVKYGLDDLDRAIADSSAHGFVKVLTVPGKDKILGVTIVGEHAGDLIAEYVMAMKHGLGMNKLLGTIHIYPTLTEANKMAAGMWKKAHAPQHVLRWVEKFHAWART